MKKSLAKKITLSILTGAVMMSSNVVWAAPDDIIDGDNKVLWTYVTSVGYVNNSTNNPDGKLPNGINQSHDFYGVYSNNGDVNDGKVTVDVDVHSNSTVYGGYSKNGSSDDNSVIVSGAYVHTSKGVYGGYSETGSSANRNEVVINSGTLNTNVYGGASFNGTANENHVVINGGTLNCDVYGGASVFGSAKGNTINISGDANLENSNLFGGAVVNTSSGAITAEYGTEGYPNTLNIGWDGRSRKPWTNRKVNSIQGFDVINIDGVTWDEGNPFIKVSGQVELKDTKVVAYIAGDKEAVQSGKMTLISAGSIFGDVSDDSEARLYSGVAKVYEGKIVNDSNNINVELTKLPVMNEQVLVIGESRVASTAFTNQGSELVETGLDALARDNTKAGNTKVFAALYGNASEYATGSHVKVNGFSGFVGIGKTNANGLTVGAFFENGEGNYRTYNTLDGEFMRGDGEANYNGGGFLVRKDNANGVYTEASLRAGNLQNELRNAVKGSDGLAGYDIDTLYYGAHVGIGKVIPRGNDGDSIDVYGKFIYTHHDSENFKIDGDEFRFDSVDSERLRLGFRLNEVQNNKLNMYYGAAWEYEFGGDADNTVIDYDLATPSLGGSTVIGEIGAHYKASDKWSLDLNGRAYVGQREGFSGSVQANYAF